MALFRAAPGVDAISYGLIPCGGGGGRYRFPMALFRVAAGVYDYIDNNLCWLKLGFTHLLPPKYRIVESPLYIKIG